MQSPSIRPNAPLSRRSLLTVGLGGALGVGLAASGISFLTSPDVPVSAALARETPYPPGYATPALAPITPIVPVFKPAPSAVQAYHGVTGDTHQAKFNDLGAQGYRMISLSIYGDPNDARYAAVWIQRPGTAFIGMHGITAADYQSRFNDAVAQGYAPVLLSVTGPADNARFAAVFEQGVAGITVAQHGLPYSTSTEGDPNSYIKFSTAQGLIHSNPDYTPNILVARSISFYGDASDRRWAAIYNTVAPHSQWLYSELEDANTYQSDFDDATQHGYVPSALAVSGDARFAAVYTSTSVGTVLARHNLTAAQYQQAFNDATAQGLIPLCVQGGGIGNGTRYAAIFATHAP